MVIKIEQISETKNFWTFKNKNTEKTYDLAKDQLRLAFKQLENWQSHSDNCFSSILFGLMGKADSENFTKLFNGFPARTTAYILWFFSDNKKELYEKYIKEDKDGTTTVEL